MMDRNLETCDPADLASLGLGSYAGGLTIQEALLVLTHAVLDVADAIRGQDELAARPATTNARLIPGKRAS